jgi:hypothetical protein
MSDDDSFENRLRAIADQFVRSLSDNDLDDVAQRFGVDADRARGIASDIERWLGGRLFDEAPRAGNQPSSQGTARHAAATAASGAGPHPLDLPTPEQGIALSALDSGRFTVRPGSSVFAAAGTDSGSSLSGAADLPNELRARDWITADGTVTLVGRQALLRWCRAADRSAESEHSEPGDT